MNIDKAAQINGWMSTKELYWLAAQAAKSDLILEVGSHKGRSSRVLADNTAGKVYCVDPWCGAYLFDDGRDTGIKTGVYGDFVENMADHIQSGKVISVCGLFDQMKWEDSFRPDFIFIDGDHRLETVKRDIKLARKLLAEDGILAGHDYGDKHWPGVKLAVDELIGSIELCGTIWMQK